MALIFEGKPYKKIPEFENYGCTEDGIILSLSVRAHNYHIKRIKKLAAAMNNTGYMQVALCKDGKGHTFTVHRLVAITWLSGRKKGLQVNHKDGNKLNNHASNLEYVSHAENIRHSWEIGLRDKVSRIVREKLKGEKCCKAKISDKQFRQLLEDHKNGMRNKDLSKKYGLHQSTISHYTCGNTRRTA